MRKKFVPMKAVERVYIETEYDYDIFRTVFKKINECGDPYGHGIVYYEICFQHDLLAECKTLEQAKKFIEKLL